MGQLGVQLTPSTDSRQLVGLARRLSGVADILWVQDQLLARNVYALLSPAPGHRASRDGP